MPNDCARSLTFEDVIATVYLYRVFQRLDIGITSNEAENWTIREFNGILVKRGIYPQLQKRNLHVSTNGFRENPGTMNIVVV